MATVHDASAPGADAGLVVDIDLAILGADEREYQRFETNVRLEYRWVPAPLYRKTRRKILRSFLERDAIYSTKHFRDKYESDARSNLTRAISALGGKWGT